MNKTITDITNDVRVVIDEIATNDSEFSGGQDFAELNTIVSKKVCEAVDYVHRAANANFLQGDAVTLVDEITAIEHQPAGRVEMPDFLRFILAYVSSWYRNEKVLITEDSAEYLAVKDSYVGADREHPAAVLRQEAGNNQVGYIIELLPYQNGDTGKVAYIKKCTIENDSIVVDSGVYESMINYLAGLVLMVLNDDRGENLIALANKEIGVG